MLKHDTFMRKTERIFVPMCIFWGNRELCILSHKDLRIIYLFNDFISFYVSKMYIKVNHLTSYM